MSHLFNKTIFCNLITSSRLFNTVCVLLRQYSVLPYSYFDWIHCSEPRRRVVVFPRWGQSSGYGGQSFSSSPSYGSAVARKNILTPLLLRQCIDNFRIQSVSIGYWRQSLASDSSY